MHYSESIAALAPDENHRILPILDLGQSLLDILGRLHRLTVYRLNDVARRDASVIRRTAGLHPRDYRSLNVAWSLKLVANIGVQIGETQSPSSFSLGIACALFANFRIA